MCLKAVLHTSLYRGDHVSLQVCSSRCECVLVGILFLCGVRMGHWTTWRVSSFPLWLSVYEYLCDICTICQIFQILINLKCEEPETRTEINLDCQLFISKG